MVTRACSRRGFLSHCAAAAASATPELPLLADPQFHGGCMVLRPEAGKKIRAGTLLPTPGPVLPVWELAQWHSRFSLAAVEPRRLPSGAAQFFDGAKYVIFGPPGAPEADVVLGLDAVAEYERRAPNPGDAWPHLLLSSELQNRRPLPSLAALRLRISYRLLECEAVHPDGWNARRHTAQFVLYLVIQNLNRNSPGFGDYYWFGVQMYDARYRLSPQYAAKDVGKERKPGTGKYIFNLPTERFTTHSAHDREWVTIDKDLLPMMSEGLEAAWAGGHLPGSHDPADYQAARFSIGWEITGTLKAALQVRGLDLRASLRDGLAAVARRPGLAR